MLVLVSRWESARREELGSPPTKVGGCRGEVVAWFSVCFPFWQKKLLLSFLFWQSGEGTDFLHPPPTPPTPRRAATAADAHTKHNVHPQRRQPPDWDQHRFDQHQHQLAAHLLSACRPAPNFPRGQPLRARARGAAAPVAHRPRTLCAGCADVPHCRGGGLHTQAESSCPIASKAPGGFQPLSLSSDFLISWLGTSRFSKFSKFAFTFD
jgi:hypothetical protein